MSCELKVRAFLKDEMDRLRELAKNDEIARKDLDSFQRDSVIEIKEKLDSLLEKHGDANISGFRREAQEILNASREATIQRRVEQIQSAIIRTKFRMDAMADGKAKNPLQRLAAMILGDKSGLFGEADSVDTRRMRHSKDLLNFLQTNFTKAERNLISNRANAPEQRMIGILMEHMDESGTVPASVRNNLNPSELEMRMASKLKKFNDFSFKKMLEAGIDIGYLKNFSASRHIDLEKIALATKQGTTAVKKKLKEALDLEKTFGNLREYTNKKTGKTVSVDEQIDEILEKTIKDMRSKHYSNPFAKDFSEGDAKGRGSLAGRMESSRKFVYKPEGWADFNAEFGAMTLGESITASIDTTSRRLALVEKFGKNPEQTFAGIRKDIEKWANANNRTDIQELLKKDSTGFMNIRMQDAWEDATGKANISVSPNWTTFWNTVKSLKYMAILGRTTITAINDQSSMMAMLSATTGQNPLKGYSDIVAETLKQTGEAMAETFGESVSFRQRADNFGFAIEMGFGAIMRRMGMDPDAKVPNFIAKIQSMYETINPIGVQQLFHKNAFMTAWAAEVGGQLKAGDLHPNLMKTFKRAGISEEYMDGLKHMVGQVEGMNHKADLFMAGHASKIPDDVANSIIAKLKAQDPTVRLTPDQFRQQLRDKVEILNIELGNDAVPTPGAKERVRMRGGTKRGSFQGELIGLMTPLKSIAFKMSDVTRNIYNASDKKSDTMLYMSSYLMSGMGIAMASMATKDIASGNTPRDMSSAESIKHAMMLAGAGGIFMDLGIQLTDQNGRTTLESFTGPVLGDLIKGGVILGKAGQNLEAPSGKQSYKWALRNSPIPGNHLLMRPAFDYMLGDTWMDAIDPKAKRRRERNLRKRNQERLWD